jgi:hypothetical protein
MYPDRRPLASLFPCAAVVIVTSHRRRRHTVQLDVRPLPCLRECYALCRYALVRATAVTFHGRPASNKREHDTT